MGPGWRAALFFAAAARAAKNIVVIVADDRTFNAHNAAPARCARNCELNDHNT